VATVTTAPVSGTGVRVGLMQNEGWAGRADGGRGAGIGGGERVGVRGVGLAGAAGQDGEDVAAVVDVLGGPVVGWLTGEAGG